MGHREGPRRPTPGRSPVTALAPGRPPPAISGELAASPGLPGVRRRPPAADRARARAPPDPAPAPRARSPATGDGLRSTSHLVFHCGDRGSVSRRQRPPRPAPAARPDLLAVPQLDLALHQRRLGHLLSWFPRPAAPLPAAPRAAQPRVTFKIAPGAPCAGRRGGGRGGARGGRGRGASPPVLPHPRPAWAMRPPRHLGPPERPALRGCAPGRGSDPGAPTLLTPVGWAGEEAPPSESKGNDHRKRHPGRQRVGPGFSSAPSSGLASPSRTCPSHHP